MKKTRYPGLFRLPDGRFKIRVVVTDRRTGKRRESTKTLAPGVSEGEALQEMGVLRDALVAAAPVAPLMPPSTSVNDYAVQWLEARSARVRPSVAERYRHAITKFIVPQLGALRFDTVTRGDIERWVTWAEKLKMRNGKPYAKLTVQGWWRILRQVVQDAVVELKLPVDPTLRVRPPSPRVQSRREKRTLTHEQLGKLLAAVAMLTPERYAEIFVLAFTGMRPGELYALHWPDIDFGGERIVLQRSVWRGIENATKTEDPREVALTKEIAALLRAHRRAMMTEQNRLKLESGLVFPSEAGTHRNSVTLHKPLELAAEAAKIDVHVTPQVLRRTFNTLLVRAGVDRIVLRSQMGHSSEAMTSRYAGIGIDAKQDAVGQLLTLTGYAGDASDEK